jgi:transcriptional regulator with XRE-family HTH domain
MPSPLGQKYVPDLSTPGDRLQYAIARAGLTPAEAERKTNMSQGYMSRVISGAKPLTAKIALPLARLLGVPVEWLLEGKEPPRLAENEAPYVSPTKRPAVPVRRIAKFTCGACGNVVEPGLIVCQRCLSPMDWSDVKQFHVALQLEPGG